MAGVCDLNGPYDLLAKLGRELDRLRQSPNDADHAFNFFVTADHMLDWLDPGYGAAEKRRKSARENNSLLQLVSHIANGAKHFDRLSHHQPNPVMRRILEQQLTIDVGAEAGKAMGAYRITALSLADRVYAYWAEPGRI